MVRDIIADNGSVLLAIGGLLIGAAFGAIVFRTNFCTMGSLSDIHAFGDYRRFRAWLLAAATALIGAQLLDLTGVVALDASMYLGQSLNWAGHILGGLMFGFGMVFSGGCPSRNLARAGGGDLRSLFTLIVVGLFAYITIGGILGPLRVRLEQATSLRLPALGAATQSLGDVLGAMAGLDQPTGALLALLLLSGATLLYCFTDASFRSSPVHIASGIGVGLTVVAGWALTGLSFDELADRPVRPISLTFVRPLGDALEWLQRFTAAPAPGFGVTSVFGAILGAFLMAKWMGRFQLATFSDRSDTLRNLFGAALMGIGGVMALGCTIGQGITGVSTLAIGSLLTFAAIAAGAFYGFRVLERELVAA
jgi:uncharacterized membrane protein YedE/YeeE